MISHVYKCIFTHIPKTGGKSIKTLFGLPEFERDYKICDHEHKIDTPLVIETCPSSKTKDILQ